MTLAALQEKFYQLVAPSLPNEWDVEEALEPLLTGETAHLEAIFSQVPVIWPISHALCFAYLASVSVALRSLEPGELPLWVNETLDIYERDGLHGARLFMRTDPGSFSRRLHGTGSVRLEEIIGTLQPYINGLAGREMPLAAAREIYTDTQTIFLPVDIDVFPSREDNFFLYKLIATFQWAFADAGTFNAPTGHCTRPAEGNRHPLEAYFHSFPHPESAASLYHFFETVRIRSILGRELPGLIRTSAAVFVRLLPPASATRSATFLARLQQAFLSGEYQKTGADETYRLALELMAGCAKKGGLASSYSQEAVVRLLPLLQNPAVQVCTTPPLLFQGYLHLAEVNAARQRGRKEREELFVSELATFLLKVAPGKNASPDINDDQETASAATQEQGVALIVEDAEKRKKDSEKMLFIRIDNEEIQLNNDLQHLAKTIRDDLGFLPHRYVSSAAGRAGRGGAQGSDDAPAGGEESAAPVRYDEWDYRRKGFKKNWCVVTEKDIPSVQTAFVESTLVRYRGQIRRLRHQFEMLRTTERFVHRQRDGNDIDFDALVDSLADMRAGCPPSDRLFIRLNRDQRDIAVYFLVDMSNSTEGWVGTTIKESLVLICEAMEVLNDRYGIYGFSGMRRLRCELFPIKLLTESFSPAVRKRIGGIGPREYTRMAPAIRHLTSLFQKVEAKVRLLIILSDGKPEDYDDYKGDYAIEDTRHALLEARIAGVHPFCITIDRQAQDYMAHMYGEVNYIFVDDIRRLPSRIPEIYRMLTT